MGTTTLAEDAVEQEKRVDSTVCASGEKPLRADARRNRDRIIAVAQDAFIDEGADVQMEAIAKRAGVGIGTLYRNFPTKDALFGEVMRHRVQSQIERTSQLCQQEDGTAALRDLVMGWAQESAAHIGLRDLVTEAPAGKYCQSESAVYRRHLSALLERAISAGAVRPDVTVDDLGALLCALSSAINSGGTWRLCAEVLVNGLRPS